MNGAEKLDPKSLPNNDQERRQLAATLRGKALEAKTRGELLTAMLYASDALMLFPNEREYLDLVDDIASSSPDPLSLTPVATGAVHIATAAARARILMVQKNLRDALALIGKIVEVAPDVDYLDWARRWMVPHIIQSIGFDELMRIILRQTVVLCVDIPVPPHPEDRRLNNAVSAVSIFEAVRTEFPDQAITYWAEATARRRVGQAQEAVAVAHAGTQRFPDDGRLQCALMLALGDAKRPDEALHAARRALQLDPQDHSPLHDVAWCFADVGRYPEATSLFEELLRLEPDYPGARSGFHYARFKANGAPEDRQALMLLRERNPGDGRIRKLSDEIDPIKYYYNFLLGPGDATASGVDSITRELAAVLRCCGAGANIGYILESNALESPSVPLALDVSIRALGGNGANMEVRPEDVQSPDPRLDKAQVAFRLWQYDGTTASRVYPAADPNVQAMIANIALQLFREDVWGPAAQQAGAQCGPQWVHALMAVMTDPPLPPPNSGFDGVIWTYRCQVATALVLSYLDPWGPEAVSRSALYALVYGPTDWTTSAGLIAFGWRARQEPAIRQEAEAMFAWMRGQIPKRGFTCWENVLNLVWLGLDNLAPELQADLERWNEEYDATVHLKGAARPPARRYGGLTLEQYAEFCFERDRILQSSGMAGTAAMAGAPPQELVELCQRFGVPAVHPQTGSSYPYIAEWQEAISDNPRLSEAFAELSRDIQLKKQGVKAEEVAALDQIREGNMDMHLRMAQQQQAQREVNEGGGDPDPEVFPGQPVARLSDYVAILKGMQGGDMNGALAPYGLDMMTYGSVATAWGAKLAADPVLNERFSRMMAS